MGDDTQLLIASRYRLVRPLGAGGMGEVWDGHDDVLGRAVAFKVIDLRPTSDDPQEELRSRALREARAAAKIDHPRTVRIYDVVDAGDNLYLVMELVRADHLDEVVGRDGPLDPPAAARLGLDVLAALTAARAAGVVHRDVKPGNVLVLSDGRVKLGDFGIATITQEPDLTATGLVVGTDPDGEYVRIGSATPASNGGDPSRRGRSRSGRSRELHPDYERVRIEETSHRDHAAAIWEYTYEGQHADNLGFVIDDTGYALSFVTVEGSWNRTAELREAFRAAFSPG